MFTNEYFAARDEWRAATDENSARAATAWGTVHTVGWGEFVLDEAIMFGVTFTEQPIISYGFCMDDDNQLVTNQMPRCSGGVLRWVQDTNDFYVGAHVMVTVGVADPMLAIQAWLLNVQIETVVGSSGTSSSTIVPQVPVDYTNNPQYDLTHSFTFAALAIKDITS